MSRTDQDDRTSRWTRRRLSKLTSVADVEARAKRMLPRMIYDYVAGGADDERSLAWNYESFGQWGITPRVLLGVSRCRLETSVLGLTHRLPVYIAPTGLSGALWRGGESAAARAAVQHDVSMMVSAASTQSLETVAENSGDPSRLAFQLFVYKDRQFTRDLVKRTAKAGYGSLVVTVDVPVSGRRARDIRNGFTIPPEVRCERRWTCPAGPAGPSVRIPRGPSTSRTSKASPPRDPER